VRRFRPEARRATAKSQGSAAPRSRSAIRFTPPFGTNFTLLDRAFDEDVVLD
jgi:hypothetical protein